MKGLVFAGDGAAEVRDFPDPQAGAGEAEELEGDLRGVQEHVHGGGVMSGGCACW